MTSGNIHTVCTQLQRLPPPGVLPSDTRGLAPSVAQQLVLPALAQPFQPVFQVEDSTE